MVLEILTLLLNIKGADLYKTKHRQLPTMKFHKIFYSLYDMLTFLYNIFIDKTKMVILPIQSLDLSQLVSLGDEISGNSSSNLG